MSDKYKWIARKNGKVVAEATDAYALFVKLHEQGIRGAITQLVPVDPKQLTDSLD